MSPAAPHIVSDMLPRLWWDRWHIDQRSRFPREEIFPLMERWPNRTSNNSWALPKKHTAGQRFRLFCLLREIRGVLCFAPIGRPTCMTKRSSRSFCSALRSIRQSKNVNESCAEKDPDVAVRAIRVIWPPHYGMRCVARSVLDSDIGRRGPPAIRPLVDSAAHR